MKSIASALIAGAALFSAQAVQAQQNCASPADFDDTLRYAMPLIYEAAMSRCGDQYSANGFMKSQGPDFADGFRAMQDDAWPGTMRLIKTVLANGGDSSEAEQVGMLFNTIPADALRPFVDAMVVQKVAEEIKPDSCAKIEQGVELIAPLPPENVTGLLTFLVSQIKRDEGKFCIAEATGE